MTRAPSAQYDSNYIPGCSTVRLNDHVLTPKYRVTTDMPGWNTTSGYGFPPGSQLIGLLKDSAAAPYNESDYAYAWLMKYDDLKHVRSVSVVVNGVVQDTKEILHSSDANTSYGLELSADGSELYFLMAGDRHSGLVSVHGSVGNGTENDQDTVHIAYQGAHRYFDGIPVVNPSSYAANAFAFWELRTVNMGGTPASLGSFSDPLNSDAGLIYRATGLSLPTNRSIVITDRMNDQKGPSTPLGGTYGNTHPSVLMNVSTRAARATDGFSKRTGVHYYPASVMAYAEHLIKTEPAPLEHPTGLTITDSTPTSVTMSWTAGAVDNYTLFYDNATRVNREGLGRASTPLDERHYGWFYRSDSFGTKITPTIWDWDNSSMYAGTPKLPSCRVSSIPQQCFQRDFADFRREGISGTSATITGLYEGVSDFLLKSNHSKQLGFWPYPYYKPAPHLSGWERTELSYQKTFGAESVVEKPTGTAVIKTSGSPTTTVSSTQAEVTIRWDNSSLSGHHYYKLYHKEATSVDSIYNIVTTDNSTYDGVITINDESSNSYVHSGLTEGAYYHYKLTANTIAGETSDTTLGGDGTYHTTQIYSVANSVTITHSGGSTTVNEAGYGEGVYDWSDLIGNSGDDRAYAVTRDAIGNVYVGVQTTSSLQGSNAGSHDAALVKYNSVGVKQWTRQTGSSAADYVKAVATDSEGNAYIIGDVSNASYDGQSPSGDRDVFITKYSSNGTKQWSKQFGTAQNDQVADAVIDNNTLYIIGSTKGTMSGASKTSASATYQDSFITRLDSSGNILGSDQFGVSGTNNTVASDMAFDDSGNYYVAGSSTGALDSESHSGNSKTDMFIRKYNSSNVRQWTKLIGNSTHDQGNGVHLGLSSSGATIYLQDQTGGTINSVSAPTSASDHLVIHAIRASDRAFEWTKFTSHRANTVRGIGADSSGYIYTLHDSSISPAGYDDDLDGNYQITKFNSSGTEQWARLTGSGDSGFDFPLGMYVTKGGQLYVAGTTQAGVLNSSSTWDYKFHGETSSGSFDAVIFKANGANDYVGRDNITVVLSAAPSATVTVNIAGFSTEFTVEPTQLTFTTSNWNTPQTVYIHAIQDNTTDGNQTENLTITTSSSDSNYNGLTVNTPVTIAEQTPIAPSVGIGFDNATVTEGNSGTQTRTLTAYLDQLHSSNVTVNLAYGSGSSCTATSGSSNDFAYASSSMTISAGQSQATQNVNIYGDTTVEDNETACIDISSVTNATEDGTQRATLTIINDDTASSPAFRYSATSGSTSVSETGTTDNLNLYLASAPNGNVVVDVTVSDSTEISVSPTQLTFTNANYMNTQNITVTGVDDALDDNDTVSQVTIAINGSTTDTTGYASLSSSSRNVTTTDDEVPPSGTPSLTNAVAATQQVTLSWSTLSGATYYKFYYKQDSTVNYSINVANSSTYDGTFTVSDGSATSYVHAGLSAGRYHYTMVAGNVAGDSAQSNMRDAGVVSNFSTTSCNADNDADLLVHYDFDSNANDKVRKYGDGRYDLSVANGGSITYANSRCTGGKAAYLNAGNQYGYNSSLNDDNESNLFSSGNFTVSLWFYADPDMPDFSSLMSSKISSSSGGDGGNYSWQLDSNDRKLRWRSQQGTNSSTKVHTLADTRYPTNSWGHGAFVKHDNGTAQIYMNSTLVATRLSNQPTPMDMLKIGTNRKNELSWKGYIDEFKIYSRSLTASEVSNLYSNDTPVSKMTSFTKGVNFTSSNGYLIQNASAAGQLPLYLSGQGDSSLNNGSTTANGQPWAVGIVFNPSSIPTGSPDTNYRSLWSQAAGTDMNGYRISLDLIRDGKIRFYFGKNYHSSNNNNWYKWTSNANFYSSNNWYGLYVDYDGGRRNYGNSPYSERVKNFNRFRIWQVNLDNGTATRLTGYGLANTDNGTWSYNNSVGNNIGGRFYVGSQYQDNKEFQGQIASAVVTTLRNSQTLPDATEISMIVNDPMKWLNDYKVGNNWRQPNLEGSGNELSGFALGNDNNGAKGTKVWLMGDGTNDSNGNIRNQVSNGSSTQELISGGSPAPAIQNISLP